jgi:hypothetical protein
MGRTTKIDVARRQLACAIRLFFADDDLVSIYSLGANAWEVIDALCSRDSVGSISSETREHVRSGSDLKRDYVNSPYRNFFKHADKDPEETLPDIEHPQVEAILFLAVEDYIRLVRKSPVEFQVFQLWYLAININKGDPGALAEVLRSTEAALPGIRDAARVRQVAMGQQLLRESGRDASLLADPHTQSAF